jgi:phosphatidate cytidylyltransferase
MSETIETTNWPRGITSFERKYGNAVTRVLSGVVGIPIVFGCVWLGGWAFFLFMTAVIIGATLEFYWILEKRGTIPNKTLGIIAGLLLAFAFMHGVSDHLLLNVLGVGINDLTVMLARMALMLGVLLVFAIAVMIDEMYRKEGSPILNNIATFAGVTYVGLFLATLIGLRQLFVSEVPIRPYIQHLDPALLDSLDRFGAYTVFGILATIWICDSAAYYAGRAFGKHKLFERVSPKKTWEGSIAGAIFAVITMIALQHWVLKYLLIGDAIAIGLIVGIFGQLGDLAESHLKRDAGIKDSSFFIPGHGGVFDRFDSLLFVAPLVYLYINFIVLWRGVFVG